MYSKKTIALLLALHVTMLAYAQLPCTLTVSGQVLDEMDQPVIGASVSLLPSGVGQSSDISGNFRFEGICPGKYILKVQMLGYQEAETTVELGSKSIQRTFHMKELATQLNEVVVTDHHDAAQTEHANNFVQLGEKQLAESAGKSLGETLKEISGVNSIQTGPGIFKPVIHGVHSQRILILNYGIRQEGQQWGAEHAPEIDPFIASNIVVIKDASSIKYGTDALGGVIVVNPEALPDKAGLGGMINTVLQSNGRSGTVSGMVEGGIKGRNGWGWRLQGTGKRTGDFHTPAYSLTNTGIKELNFSASAGYHVERKGLDIFFSHFQTAIGILKGTAIGSLDDLVNAMEREQPQYTTGFSYKISEPRQEVSHNLLKINGHIQTSRGEWRLQYGFQNNNRKEFDMRIGDLSRIPAIDLRLNTHTVDAEWETLHSEKRTISVGVNTMMQQNVNVPGTQRIPFIPNFTSTSAGLFAITKIFLSAWTIDLGARYDVRHYDVKGFDYKNTLYHTSFNFNNISATAGARVDLTKSQTLNLNLSSAWRPPHVAELYSLGTHQSAAAIEYGLLLDPNTNEVRDIRDVNFRTEQALKFVATYQVVWKDVTLEISPYVNYIFNYIYLKPVGITKTVRGVYPYFRYAQTDALFLGTDFTATWHVTNHVQVIPKVSLLRASDERNNDLLLFIPSNKYEVAIRFDKPQVGFFRNFYLESKTKYIAKQTRAPRVVTVREIKEADEQQADPFDGNTSNFDFMDAPDGYWMWNVATGASVKRKKVQYDFRVSCDNTLNQSYREYTNRFHYYADDLGRNIIFSLKCIF